MKVIGIVAEYNPFHKGHAYQIAHIRKKLDADYVIIAMSGNFVQRGAPALLDKYTRARMALSCGADLVLEIPALCATASAEYFAKGGVNLLQRTGVVTDLCFGAESENIDLLKKAASVLAEHSASFEKDLQKRLKTGISYPLARAQTLEEYLVVSGNADLQELSLLLNSPNNILAIEYLKYLTVHAKEIIPRPILRKGQGYHDTQLRSDSTLSPEDTFASASAIRSLLHRNLEQSSAGKQTDERNFPGHLSDTMPANACEILNDYPHPFLFEDDFSALVHYKILSESPEELSTYADSSADLANRIYHKRHEFVSWTQFCQLLKTKNTTYTRLSRLLLHIILNFHAEDYQLLASSSPISYLRVLGFQKKSAPLLSEIKKYGTAPLVTSVSDALKVLPQTACQMIKQDIICSDIYNLALTAKGNQNLRNDHTHPIVIL